MCPNLIWHSICSSGKILVKNHLKFHHHKFVTKKEKKNDQKTQDSPTFCDKNIMISKDECLLK